MYNDNGIHKQTQFQRGTQFEGGVTLSPGATTRRYTTFNFWGTPPQKKRLANYWTVTRKAAIRQYEIPEKRAQVMSHHDNEKDIAQAVLPFTRLRHSIVGEGAIDGRVVGCSPHLERKFATFEQTYALFSQTCIEV